MTRSKLHHETARLATTLRVIAARCDAMCLTAGVQLGEAVPGLYDLSRQFASLSEVLVDESGAKPTAILESVARDLLSTGAALSAERDAVTAVITLNGVLTRRISDLADSVRFLSSVVSNVKIEIAAINEGELRLEGFAENLKQLALKSEQTVSAFRATHQTLVRQLQLTANAQSAFVASHGLKFATASEEISASLGAVSGRRNTVAKIAGEIGAITQKTGTQIAQCVVALQIGDSTRQRLEHASDGLSDATNVAAGACPDGLADEAVISEAPLHCAAIGARICRLEAIQTAEATADFSTEIGTIANLITDITDASSALVEQSLALVSSPGDTSQSFLADLEEKLASASQLIEECGTSRKLVDNTAEEVIAAVLSLQSLAKDVAAMATDMMIIGTNAVVTSYRLGTKGLPLSVIAQHLRNHAVRVTDAVKLVSPALDKVLEAAKQFTAAREGQDAGSMEGLALRITDALASFAAADATVADVRTRLVAELSTVDDVLRQARDAFDSIEEIERELGAVVETLGALGTATDDSVTFPDHLSQLLRARYTMGFERTIHDTFFADCSPILSDGGGLEASVWL